MLTTGCGNSYRPVVSAINPVGPAGQPTKYAVAVSSPSAATPGLVTFVDFSGDTVLSTPSILPNPSYFAETANGVSAYVINPVGAIDTFGLSNPTGLLTSNIVETTLPPASAPVSISALSILGTGTTVFVPQQATSTIAELSSNGPTLEQVISVGANPMYVVGIDGAPRVYAISQNASGAGQVASIESTTLSISATIPVGSKPVYGVMSADAKRTFILNKGDATVNVINTFTNALDVTTPLISLTPAPPLAATLGLNPVWADLSTVTNELVVLSAGDGVHPGSVSIINTPLCTASTPVTNPNCSSTNPTDATGFGTVLATVPVGINPTMVSVLHDGSRAYVANTLDSTGQCAAGQGSVSVVNLTSGVVTATICGTSSAINTNDFPTLLYGHPNTIAATTGNPTGKVYVTSSDSKFLTVIYTDTDSVVTHVPIQGAGVRVVVTQP